MHAEVFPVKKIPLYYGNRSFVIGGKDYDDLQASIPKYRLIVNEAETSIGPLVLNKSIADREDFLDFYGKINGIEYKPESEMEELKDKMRYRQFRYDDRTRNSMNFPVWIENDPIDWLDGRFAAYRFIRNIISIHYVRMSRLRLGKSISNKDYCSQLADSLRNDPNWVRGKTKNAHELVFRCYDIFPYNESAAGKIFDSGILMAEFYVFSNYSTNGAGADMVLRGFKEQKLHFDSSLHFHDYFGRVINRMRDAHITYKVNCFEQFTFVQPLFLQFYDNKLYVTKVNTPELQEWIGAEVMYIDGVKAEDKISEYVEKLGKCHYLQQRFSLGIARLYFDSNSQDFLLDRGLYLKRTVIPYTSQVIYVLRKPDGKVLELKVDWLVFKNPSLVDFVDQYSYWKNNCEEKPLKRIVKPSASSLQSRSVGALITHASGIEKRSLNEKLQKRSDATNYRTTVDGTVPIVIGPGFAFFILNDSLDGDYGVLVIQTFNVEDTYSWFKKMRMGFLTLMDRGITKLLLDLSGNSGGVLCLAYSLLGVFSPSPTYPYPATQLSFGTRTLVTNNLKRIAICADEAKLKVSPFKLQSFTNLETRSDFPDGSTWETGSEKIPKKMPDGCFFGYSIFSQFLLDKCTLKGMDLLADIKSKFKPIILVTDGLCGSSCAIVAAYLQWNDFYGIVLTQHTGSNARPNLYTFAGGQVVNFNNVKDVAIRSSCFDMIPDILENTYLSISYRAIFYLGYGVRDTPLEYTQYLTYQQTYTQDYANSFLVRWKDFFPLGIKGSNGSIDRGYDNGDLLDCEGSDLFC